MKMNEKCELKVKGFLKKDWNRRGTKHEIEEWIKKETRRKRRKRNGKELWKMKYERKKEMFIKERNKKRLKWIKEWKQEKKETERNPWKMKSERQRRKRMNQEWILK